MSAVSGFYAFAKGVLTPIMTPWVKFTVTGEENLPMEGGFLLVSNHLSNVDPLCLCWYFMKRNTAVRFLAKKSMFSVPVFGWIIKGMGLIPVNRDSNPSAVLAPTREALGQARSSVSTLRERLRATRTSGRWSSSRVPPAWRSTRACP